MAGTVVVVTAVAVVTAVVVTGVVVVTAVAVVTDVANNIVIFPKQTRIHVRYKMVYLPCLNGGLCTGMTTDPTKYTCKCEDGYEGNRCQSTYT